jgi:hypothetical protein
MTRHELTGRLSTAGLVVGLALACPLIAQAQSGGPYDLSWSTVDCGGATPSTGGSYSLGGTAGQSDAGLLSGGDYTLRGGFWSGGPIVTAVDEPQENDPPRLVDRLYRTTPNPFNPRTQIAFDLARPGTVRLGIYDLRGALVRTLERGPLPAGHHVRIWDGTTDRGAAAASGIYFVTIDTDGFHARQKGVLIR